MIVVVKYIHTVVLYTNTYDRKCIMFKHLGYLCTFE